MRCSATWRGVRVEVDFQRGSIHDRKHLMRTLVEGAGREVLEKPTPHLGYILLCSAEREEWRRRRRGRPSGAVARGDVRLCGGDAEAA